MYTLSLLSLSTEDGVVEPYDGGNRAVHLLCELFLVGHDVPRGLVLMKMLSIINAGLDYVLPKNKKRNSKLLRC
ncbi:hypothetical protein SSCH_2630003 [Syntrophaceticus schinkii]|uniref:Uncharacterized protein n=1 Tax=Syntrophaceticus schinkii TaxID=499207 RepID=A0A0B7ME07_9FIRM|nr:hypothetical protein SSCH_2630003 [Syntrophaceticus schinkii]